MRIAVLTLLMGAVPVAAAQGAFTDFSDYPQTTAFSKGTIFESRGISFEAIEILAILNPVRIAGAVENGGFLLAGPGTAILLPLGAQEMSFDYSDGAGVRFVLNGVQPSPYPGQDGVPYHAGLSFLNGMSLAGVEITITTTDSQRGYEAGTMTLRGPISSVAIAGLELSIDNLSITVPEPAAAALSLVAIAALARRRARQRHR